MLDVWKFIFDQCRSVNIFFHKDNVKYSLGERYLGMWKNDSRHGKGILIGIEGTYHEGQFDNNRLVVRFEYKMNNSDPCSVYLIFTDFYLKN